MHEDMRQQVIYSVAFLSFDYEYALVIIRFSVQNPKSVTHLSSVLSLLSVSAASPSFHTHVMFCCLVMNS